MDYGSLLCWASNSVGRQESPCIFHLVPAGKPDPVNNCSVNNQSHSSFHLNCQPGFDGGLPQTFIMEVRDMQDGFMVSNVSSQTPSFSVNGLQSGRTFQVQIHSFNDKGQSATLIIKSATLSIKKPERRTAFGESELLTVGFTITPLLSLLIAVGAALGGVTVLTVVMLCCKNRQEAQEASPSRSSIYLGPRQLIAGQLEMCQDIGPDMVSLNNGECLM